LARDKEWVSWRMDWIKIPEQSKRNILGFPDKTALENKLSTLARERQGVPLTALHVVYAGEDQWGEVGQQQEELSTHHKQFGQAAAPYIIEQIAQANTCAVSWGRTVNSVIDSMPIDGLLSRKGMTFIPISGEP